MAEDFSSASLATNSDTNPPRIAMGEVGFNGLRMVNKFVIEEANQAFRYPQFLKTVEEMRNNPTVAAALLVYKMMLGKVDWCVEPPIGATETQIQRAKFIESCMHDMEHSWASFLTEVISYIEYGFCVHEKVFRRRLIRNGSKYNDGLVGWRKLPIRSQTSLYGWEWTADGRDLTGFIQTLSRVYNSEQYTQLSLKGGDKITIPREKFLLFRADVQKDNPEGRSLLKGAYVAYKQLQLVQDQEMIGIARDLGGIPVFGIPPKYMDVNASEADKAVYKGFIDIGEKITTGAQGSVVIPLMYDPETKMPVFKMDLLESKGGKSFDTTKIIQRLQNDVLMSLSCDILKLGGNSGDSFALADSKSNLLLMSLSYRLKEIAEVLNDDLIPSTFKMNGWVDSEYPKFKFSDFDNVSLEEISKFLQRVTSVGLVEIDRPVLNLVREAMGVEPKPDDEPVDQEALSGNSSRSGDSFSTKTGGLEGTSDSLSGNDNSTSNVENAA